MQQQLPDHAPEAEAEVATDLAQIGEAGGPDHGVRVVHGREESIQQLILVGGCEIAQLPGGAHQRFPHLEHISLFNFPLVFVLHIILH
jgi:hypothetical protein